MEKGEEVLVTGNENPHTTRSFTYEKFFQKWSTKQSLPAEAAVVTATTTAEWAAVGAVCHIVLDRPLNIESARAFPLFKGSMLEARAFAVYGGVYGFIQCVMGRLRGNEKEDIETAIVASFSSAAMSTLVCSWRRAIAIPFCVLNVLVHVGLFKWEESLLESTQNLQYRNQVQVEEKFSQPVAEEVKKKDLKSRE